MNCILILLDTLRRDHLSPYDYQGLPVDFPGNVQTPNLERLARLGVTFENYYIASAPCMPARRDIWTGRYEFPWRGWGPLEPGDCDLPGILTAAGKTTMLVTDHYHLFEHGSGNYHFHFSGWEFLRGQEADAWITDPGIAVRWPAPEFTKVHRRWAQYYRNTAQWRNTNGTWKAEEHTFCARTFRAAADWLERNKSAQDFFLVVDCFDPHEPFDPPPPLDSMYADAVTMPRERVRWPIYGRADRYTTAELRDIRALYAGKVTLVDRWFGCFLDRLESLDLLGDTAIIATTDHGHLFGEHGMIGKPSTTHGDSNFYQPMAHVPLIFYHPEFRGASLRRSQLVQPVDLYPTVLDIFAVPPPSGCALHGRSLLPLCRNPRATSREFACYGKWGEAINITDGEWTLFQWPPSTTNEPLVWHSMLPPAFLRPKSLGPYDHARGGYPSVVERGPMASALFNVARDYSQTADCIASEPRHRDRLRRALRQWLGAIHAPPDQVVRLGL